MKRVIKASLADNSIGRKVWNLGMRAYTLGVGSRYLDMLGDHTDEYRKFFVKGINNDISKGNSLDYAELDLQDLLDGLDAMSKPTKNNKESNQAYAKRQQEWAIKVDTLIDDIDTMIDKLQSISDSNDQKNYVVFRESGPDVYTPRMYLSKNGKFYKETPAEADKFTQQEAEKLADEWNLKHDEYQYDYSKVS